MSPEATTVDTDAQVPWKTASLKGTACLGAENGQANRARSVGIELISSVAPMAAGIIGWREQ